MNQRKRIQGKYQTGVTYVARSGMVWLRVRAGIDCWDAQEHNGMLGFD
jgi:hypothetical protein